jgi:hypothetical protein
MHLTMDELLALRDGDGAADAVRHVERCNVCRVELEQLWNTAIALRSLPSVEPPADTWDEISRSIVARRRRWTRLCFALVAAAVLAVAAVSLVTRFADVGSDPDRPGLTDTRLAVEYLSAASRELELVLQDPSLHSRVLSPQRAAMIVELEDRIALVDTALAQAADQEPGERAVVLWSDRVRLLDALVTARGGELPKVGVMPVENPGQGSLL